MEAFGAHGKVAYLTLPFGALMRALARAAAPVLDVAEAEPAAAAAAAVELADLARVAPSAVRTLSA